MSRTYHIRNCYEIADETSIEDSTHPNECEPSAAEWFEHDAFLSGDYVGSGPMARSNVRVLARDFGHLESKAWWRCYGSHGSEWVRFHIGVQNAKDGTQWGELRAMIDGLDDYPIADEMDESEVEMEETDEAWASYGASDFASALAAAYPHHGSDFFSAIPKDVLWTAWVALCPSGETEIHEQCGVYFPFDSHFGKRAGACKPSWSDVRRALMEALGWTFEAVSDDAA